MFSEVVRERFTEDAYLPRVQMKPGMGNQETGNKKLGNGGNKERLGGRKPVKPVLQLHGVTVVALDVVQNLPVDRALRLYQFQMME